MKRRDFLKASALFTGALGLNYIPLSSYAQGLANGGKKTGKVVYIFLRGGADVLSMFPPKPMNPDKNGLVDWKAHPLYSHRGINENLAKAFLFNSKINGAKTATKDAFSVQDYGVNFHPQWEPLKSVIDAKNFGLILHTGSTNDSRSHFAQQDMIESGSATRKLSSGFLGRAANLIANEQENRISIAVGTMSPKSLNGFDAPLLKNKDDLAIKQDRHSVYYVRNVEGGALSQSERLELFKTTTNKEYCQKDRSCKSAEGAQGTYSILSSDFSGDNVTGYMESGSDFNQSCQVAAHLTNANSNPAIITIDFNDWDDHIEQNPTVVDSDFSKRVNDLATGLKTLWDKMSSDTVVVVMSEFGRNVVANQSFGTDHGRGSAMIVLGKNVDQSRMNQNLSTNEKAWQLGQLDGADGSAALKVFTDYRQIMAEVLKSHLGVNLAAVVSQNQNLNIFDGLIEYTSRKIISTTL